MSPSAPPASSRSKLASQPTPVQSSSGGKPDRVVVVTGDSFLDWWIVRNTSRREAGRPRLGGDQVRVFRSEGGASQLSQLLGSLFGGRKDVGICCPPESPQARGPEDERFQHRYGVCSLYKGSPASGKGRWVYRLDDLPSWDYRASLVQRRARELFHLSDDLSKPALVVLNDQNLGFRMDRDLWPVLLRTAHREEPDLPWVVLTTTHPIFDRNPLWFELYERFQDRLIVVLSANDLRQMDAEISREISWERTVEDLDRELRENRELRPLTRCVAVVMSFDKVGAFVYSGYNPSQARRILLYSPQLIEGAADEDEGGKVAGHTMCLTAGVVFELLNAGSTGADAAVNAVVTGTLRGLAAGQALFDEGYGTEAKSLESIALAFPYKPVCKALTSDEFRLEQVEIKFWPFGPEKTPEESRWSILSDRYQGDLGQLAEDVARRGPREALSTVPLGSFGGLVTADRHEIEGYRSIKRILAEYCRRPLETPLSIAVFGPPGAGKSFAVRELACTVLSRRPIQFLTFNISQFSGPGDLIGPLHQVRDAGLAGNMPVVFWDEFDASLGERSLAWLRYFLAPMEDGTFQEGQTTHKIGPSVFVFAGGVCWTVEGFDALEVHGQKSGQAGFLPVDDVKWRENKGPDFKSRLRGFLNILGPDPERRLATAPGAPPGAGVIPGCVGSDQTHLVRRAILLHAILKGHAPHLFQRTGHGELLQIDGGVLNALLRTKRYRHGTRSLKAVIRMSLLAGRSRFERSCLPDVPQLRLHIENIDDFKELLNR